MSILGRPSCNRFLLYTCTVVVKEVLHKNPSLLLQGDQSMHHAKSSKSDLVMTNEENFLFCPIFTRIQKIIASQKFS